MDSDEENSYTRAEDSPKRKPSRKEPERLQPEQKRLDSSVSLLLKAGSESEDLDDQNSDTRTVEDDASTKMKKEDNTKEPVTNKKKM